MIRAVIKGIRISIRISSAAMIMHRMVSLRYLPSCCNTFFTLPMPPCGFVSGTLLNEGILHLPDGCSQKRLYAPSFLRAEQQPAPVILLTGFHPYISFLPQPLDQ